MNGGADSDIRIHGAAGYSTSSGDLAELYFSHDDLEIGDVVVFDQKTNELSNHRNRTTSAHWCCISRTLCVINVII